MPPEQVDLAQRNLRACVIRALRNGFLQCILCLVELWLAWRDPRTQQAPSQNHEERRILNPFADSFSCNSNSFRNISLQQFLLPCRQITDLTSLPEFSRKFKITFREIELIELRQKYRPLVVQTGRLRKVAKSELNNFEPEFKLLIVRTGICYKSKQLFVLWGNRSSTLQGRQGFTPLAFANIRLCQQIIDAGSLVSSSPQFL